MTQSWSNIAVAFRHKHFRTYQGGRFFAHTAGWMYRIAVGWLVWKLTYSTTWLGIFSILDQIPALLIMPLAGALTDRIDALKMLRITQALLLVQGVALAAFDYFDMLNLPILIAFTLIYGIVSAFQLPANQTILPNLMPRDALTIAYGLNSVMYNIARFVGPGLAGITITAWGTAPAIFCNAIGAAIFAGALTMLRSEFSMPEQKPKQGKRNVLGDIRDGFVYAMTHRGIRPMVIILFCLSLLPYSIELILPSLADGAFHAGASGLAWMTAILGVGAMVQASLIARRGGVTGLSFYAVGAILWMGLAFCALSFTSNFWLALVFIFIIGFCASATRVSAMTLLQYSIEPHMRGRVASIYGMITHFVPALGALIVGALGDWLGLSFMMGVIGAITLGVWFWAFFRRSIIAEELEAEAQSAQIAARHG